MVSSGIYSGVTLATTHQGDKRLYRNGGLQCCACAVAALGYAFFVDPGNPIHI